MQFLKTLFWVVLAAVAVVFAFNNQHWVSVNLWSGLVIDIFLPLLVIGAFLVGVLVVWIPHRAAKWRWRRRLDATERQLAEERGARAATEEQLLDHRNRASLPPLDGVTVRDGPALDADGRPIVA